MKFTSFIVGVLDEINRGLGASKEDIIPIFGGITSKLRAMETNKSKNKRKKRV